MAYFTDIATQLGIPTTLVVVLVIWTIAWKGVALWKSARKNSPIWFIAILVLNTAGILPILYIFIFSKIGKKIKKSPKKKR